MHSVLCIIRTVTEKISDATIEIHKDNNYFKIRDESLIHNTYMHVLAVCYLYLLRFFIQIKHPTVVTSTSKKAMPATISSVEIFIHAYYKQFFRNINDVTFRISSFEDNQILEICNISNATYLILRFVANPTFTLLYVKQRRWSSKALGFQKNRSPGFEPCLATSIPEVGHLLPSRDITESRTEKAPWDVRIVSKLIEIDCYFVRLLHHPFWLQLGIHLSRSLFLYA